MVGVAETGSEKKREERRSEVRRPVTGRIEGLLVNATGFAVDFIPVDVSRTGIGIVARGPLASGDVLELRTPIFPDLPLKLRVMWLKPLLHDQDNFRCGLKLESRGADMEDLFRSLNVILMD